MRIYDIIIIGGGASGLICAATAARRRRNVLLIDHSDALGKKISISGGGRCNFTNRNISVENYVSKDPEFCKTALCGFTPSDFISIVDRYKIKHHEKQNGQFFCDGEAAQIVTMLVSECRRARAEILLNCQIKNITKGEGFEVESSRGKFRSDALVIATGGMSVPKTGATDFGFRIAKDFGIKLVEPRPGLVPLKLSPEDRAIFSPLSGISIEAEVKYNDISFRDDILFTHRGLSGPAILNISSYWKHGEPISIDFLPGKNLFEILKANSSRKIELANLLASVVPRRFAHRFFEAFFDSRRMVQYSQKEIQNVAAKIHDFILHPSGTEGFAYAECTVGGVSTAELSPATMESKRVGGLFFIGEVIDVAGNIGGYNLQWAWSSGVAAGKSA
jgi:predicted Rossmann fold flavoprotein